MVGRWACRAPLGSPAVPRVGEEGISLVNLVLYRWGGTWFGFLLYQKGQGLRPGAGKWRRTLSGLRGPQAWNPSPLDCRFPITTVSALQEGPAPVSLV